VGLLATAVAACAALAVVLAHHLSDLLDAGAGPRRVDALVETGVTATGLVVVAWLGGSALVALSCVLVRAAGVTWRSGERLVLRCAPPVVRRALVLALGASLGLGMATGASAADPTGAPTGQPVASSSTSATAVTVPDDLDLGWAVTSSAGTDDGGTTPAATSPGSSATSGTPTPEPSAVAATDDPATDGPAADGAAADGAAANGAPSTSDPASTATASPSAPPPPAASAGPARPDAPAAASPTPASHLLAPPVRPAAGTEPATVVVLRGDSLWRIAARHLPAGADDAQIAAAWPAWYQANADVIGADPGLLLPGQVLVVPVNATVAADGAGA